MPDSKSLNDDYFIKNAIMCWLHYYPNHKWTGIYKELAKRDSYVTEVKPISETKPVSRKRSQGRTRSTKPIES